MILLAACISLMLVIGVTLWAFKPAQGDAVAPARRKEFTLTSALLVIGPETNDRQCSIQRGELKRILIPLLQGGYSIIEIYGDQPATQNGVARDWLDNDLLRDGLGVSDDKFHLIAVGAGGQTLFRSTMTMPAEALLHIFDLWDNIDGLAGEVLTETDKPAPREAAQPPSTRPEPASTPTAEPVAAVARSVEDLRAVAAEMADGAERPPALRKRQAPSHIAALIRRHRV